MEEWLRESLLEEQGYIICPLAPYSYTICDEKCDDCEYYRDYLEAIENGEED